MNKKDKKGNMPLHIAAENIKYDIIEILLEAGASVNSKNSGGKTALIQAVYSHELAEEPERVKSVNILIVAGADVNVVSKKCGYTALMYVSHYGYHKCLDLLLKLGADVNLRNNYGLTALSAAQLHWHPDGLKMLIEAGADVNVTDNNGDTALHMASIWPGNKHIDLLLKAGAEVNAMDEGGRTPLMVASSYSRENSIDLLLKAGADVNKGKDEDGETALILASHCCCIEMLSLMGADDNAAAYDGCTSLHLPKCFKRLLRAGIHINKFSESETKNALGTLIGAKDRYKDEELELVGYKDGVMVLYVAGETLEGTDVDKIPEELQFEEEKLQLKHICREAIRKHLLKLDPHQHLFGRIPKLSLPLALINYLLFHVSLETDDHHHGNDDDKSC